MCVHMRERERDTPTVFNKVQNFYIEKIVCFNYLKIVILVES